MKKIVNTLYKGLINWAETIAAYRNSNASKHYY